MSAQVIRPRWLNTQAEVSGDSVEQRMAAAFRELDGPINDLMQMARIADRLFDCDDDGLRIFASQHVADMAEELKEEYQRLSESCTR